MTVFYPVFLDLRGRRAVVLGGGAVAEQKVRGLVAAGAHVTVVSPDVTPALGALVRRNAIELKRRPYRRGDLEGAWLAIAATDDRGTNGTVWAEAEQLGVPLNAVDDLEHCSFIAPAVHREGDITVAVSTAGKSPALAVRLRERIARLVGRAEARLCELLGELRRELAALKDDQYVTWDWICQYFDVTRPTAMAMLANEKLFVYGRQVKRFKKSAILKFAERNSIKVKDLQV